MGDTFDILYVDDEPDLREIVAAALEMDGDLHVRTCGDAESAWRALNRRLPDLIILDVMMPGVDGPALFAALKENETAATVPVVFMTAKVLEPELARLRALQPAGIVQKPFNPRTLAAEIRRYCQAASAPTASAVLDPLLEDMRRRFRVDAPAIADRLRSGTNLPANDPASARRIAHTLCGLAGTIGFDDIAALAGKIDAAEETAAQDSDIAHLAAMLQMLKDQNPSGEGL